MLQAAIACRSLAAPKCKAGLPRLPRRPGFAEALREGKSSFAQAGKFYRQRDHGASPFFKIVRERFDEFERVYPERFQQRYGYFRPVIRSSIDKFLKCGDLKEGLSLRSAS